MVGVVFLKIQAVDSNLVPFQGNAGFEYSNSSQLLLFERIAEQLIPPASLRKVIHQSRLLRLSAVSYSVSDEEV